MFLFRCTTSHGPLIWGTTGNNCQWHHFQLRLGWEIRYDVTTNSRKLRVASKALQLWKHKTLWKCFETLTTEASLLLLFAVWYSGFLSMQQESRGVPWDTTSSTTGIKSFYIFWIPTTTASLWRQIKDTAVSHSGQHETEKEMWTCMSLIFFRTHAKSSNIWNLVS